MQKNDSYKKTRVFPDQRPSEFERQHRGLLTLKKAKKSAGRFSRYGTFCDSGMPGQHLGNTRGRPSTGQKWNFFWSTPNDPIRKVKRLKSIFEHLSKISPTTGCSHPSLRKFSRKIWKHDHQKPGRYTVILWWTVDISDVFIIIEGGQASVVGFAFVTSVLRRF